MTAMPCDSACPRIAAALFAVGIHSRQSGSFHLANRLMCSFLRSSILRTCWTKLAVQGERDLEFIRVEYSDKCTCYTVCGLQKRKSRRTCYGRDVHTLYAIERIPL